MSEARGVVLSRVGGTYRVQSGERILDASLRGRMKHGDGDRILVGDAVRVCLHDDGHATVEEILPRHSVLRRRMPGKAHGVRNVVANVDQLVVVGAAVDPAWDPHLIDRFVAVAEANGLPPVLVINKSDLDAAASRHGEPYHAAGYPVLVTSARTGDGGEQLRTQLAGRISVFTGPTGVGKSSLLNALVPGLTLRTAAVSERSRGGRHTTVSPEMHRFGEDGFVVDTPGLRDIGLWGLEPREVAGAFPELTEHADQCRFDNCRHCAEPGCAVTAAVARGDVSATRYASYRRLLEETERAARPWG